MLIQQKPSKLNINDKIVRPRKITHSGWDHMMFI